MKGEIAVMKRESQAARRNLSHGGCRDYLKGSRIKERER